MMTPNTACIAMLVPTHKESSNEGLPAADSGSTTKLITA
jgi:hypothetical protein